MIKVTYEDHMGSDLSVVNAARVSFSVRSTWEGVDFLGRPYLSDRDKRLIGFLARHDHKSPFNHTFISMHIKAPIFVARQLVKHKFMPWNEIFRRYVDYTPEVYEPQWRSRPEESIKQGSGGEIALERDSFTEAVREALRAYEDLLKQGVCPEQARAVLPLSCLTEWMWSGTLGAWADMIKLRTHSTAQEETREVAKQCQDILIGLYPVSMKELMK